MREFWVRDAAELLAVYMEKVKSLSNGEFAFGHGPGSQGTWPERSMRTESALVLGERRSKRRMDFAPLVFERLSCF